MQKTTTFILAALCTVMLATPVTADSGFTARGKAVATGIFSYYLSPDVYYMGNVYVSNISKADVTCRVTVYDSEGNDVSSLFSVYAGNKDPQILVGSASEPFAIPPSCTRDVNLFSKKPNTYIMGYAVIEWDSDDTSVQKPLMAEVWKQQRVKNDGKSAFCAATTVNGGQPF